MGGFDCKPVAGELTYGLERLAMYIQNVANVYDLRFSDAVGDVPGVSCGDVFLENEKQFSKWHFEVADTDTMFAGFKAAEAACQRPIAAGGPLAASDHAITPKRGPEGTSGAVRVVLGGAGVN